MRSVRHYLLRCTADNIETFFYRMAVAKTTKVTTDIEGWTWGFDHFLPDTLHMTRVTRHLTFAT